MSNEEHERYKFLGVEFEDFEDKLEFVGNLITPSLMVLGGIAGIIWGLSGCLK